MDAKTTVTYHGGGRTETNMMGNIVASYNEFEIKVVIIDGDFTVSHTESGVGDQTQVRRTTTIALARAAESLAAVENA